MTRHDLSVHTRSHSCLSGHTRFTQRASKANMHAWTGIANYVHQTVGRLLKGRAEVLALQVFKSRNKSTCRLSQGCVARSVVVVYELKAGTAVKARTAWSCCAGGPPASEWLPWQLHCPALQPCSSNHCLATIVSTRRVDASGGGCICVGCSGTSCITIHWARVLADGTAVSSEADYVACRHVAGRVQQHTASLQRRKCLHE